MITSGSVFVFDEDESGIKRWTDGFFWSPSRILGNFLLYRETEKRGAGHRSARSEQANVEIEPQYQEPVKNEGQTLSRPKSEAHRLASVDRQRERSLVGSLTNSYKFKPGGMMKKTFSLSIGGVAQHLISYYKIEDVEHGRLRSPSSLPELVSLDISPEYLDKTHFRNPPKVEIGVDGVPRYRGEADDADTSPHMLPASLSPPSPYAEADSGSSKRGKRYDPYSSNPPKRARKVKSTPPGQDTTSETPPQPLAVSVHQPQPGYVSGDPAAPVPPHYASYGYYQVPPPGYPVPPMYSGTYPAVPPPTSTPSPPQQGQPSPPAPAYAGYTDPAYAGSHYPQYYAHPHAYASYPPGMPWPHYGYPPPPPPAVASAGDADADVDDESRPEAGGSSGA